MLQFAETFDIRRHCAFTRPTVS